MLVDRNVLKNIWHYDEVIAAFHVVFNNVASDEFRVAETIQSTLGPFYTLRTDVTRSDRSFV